MGAAALTLLILISVRNDLENQDLVPAKSEEVIQSGSHVTLKCVGNGTVRWIIQGKENKKNYNDLIEIPKATYKDTRTYRCVYNNSMSSTESASVHLFVQDASNYWNSLRGYGIHFLEGQDALIPCLLTDPSIPDSAVSFEPLDYDGKSLNISFDVKKGFTILNVKTDLHEKKFKCTAKVNDNKKSIPIKIYVDEVENISSVSLKSYEEMRIEGEDFITTCFATSNIKSSITWEHNQKKTISISAEHFYSQGDIWTITSTLTIQNVSFEDSGNYTCTAGNNAESRRTSANLQVIEKAFVNVSTTQNRRLTLFKGVSVDLMVDIKSYPSQLCWKWLHNNTGNIKDVSSLSKWEDKGPYWNKSILILNRLNGNESGTYTFFANNSKASASLSFEIKLYSIPTIDIYSVTINDTKKIICTSQGYTLPTIEWLQCSDSCSDKVPLKGEQSQDTQEDLVISVMQPSDSLGNVTIFCIASNNAGTASAKILFTTILPETMGIMKDPPQFNPMMIVMTVIGAFFLLLSAFLLYKYKQKPKYEVRWQMVQMSEDNQYICIDPTHLPYNERWEFPRANLQFGKTIGAGAFGKVMEATAFGMGKDDSALKVAVKMLKPSAHTDEKEALMSELKILSHLGHHENIVNLLGACTSGGPILVITEYCQHGDLLNFLRRKAEIMNNNFTAVLANSTDDYKNMAVEQKYLGSDSGLGSESKDSYIDMKPISSNMGSTPENPLEEEDMDDHLPLDLHDLLNFSLQVAQGMSFLASKSCIHRDVAARNVLVTNGRAAKICDFGLARDIENDSNYVVKGNARLPVKWMAPESIFDCIYTVQSDVWSYGILLWEIFSLGRSPYPGVVVNRKFYKMIKDGYKMDCPDFSPLDIYRIMKACWDLEPTRRPTFNQITDLINRQMSIITNQDYTNIIQGQQEEDCADTKCVDSQPLMKGNNYQFC
ncbi:macrophage colony-stimulating factor 1 receptor [Bufo bufo]|uniref:macrophage colony-stimulating factor 1 receptor n=1 Tax=Bufo bufo TaxID=8384 RepID=UPI001ABDBEF5|nr:macrophage colony-stimulating factor 1 receptor [Bufo bufo]